MPYKQKPIKPFWVPERKAFGRRKDNSKFYNSWTWRKVSKAFKLENPFCVKCEEEGKVVAAKFTDHIERIEDGGAKFDKDNLQALCQHHHDSKSGKESHGYREKNKNKGA